MHSIRRDKAFARRMVRAGALEAVGIIHCRNRWDELRAPSNDERVLAWRTRAWQVGTGFTARGHASPERLREIAPQGGAA